MDVEVAAASGVNVKHLKSTAICVALLALSMVGWLGLLAASNLEHDTEAAVVEKRFLGEWSLVEKRGPAPFAPERLTFLPGPKSVGERGPKGFSAGTLYYGHLVADGCKCRYWIYSSLGTRFTAPIDCCGSDLVHMADAELELRTAWLGRNNELSLSFGPHRPSWVVYRRDE